jgi:hypothetical protein
MAKDKTESKPASSLGASVVTLIVTAFSTGFTAAQRSGIAMLDFCKIAGKHLDASPSDADVSVIADAISGKLGWEKGSRLKQNKSDARALLRQHAHLSEVYTALINSKHASCSYHDLVSVARAMKDGKGVTSAVKGFNTKAKAKPTDTGARLASAVQAHYQTVSESKSGNKTAKLAALRAIAEAFGFEAVK